MAGRGGGRGSGEGGASGEPGRRQSARNRNQAAAAVKFFLAARARTRFRAYSQAEAKLICQILSSSAAALSAWNVSTANWAAKDGILHAKLPAKLKKPFESDILLYKLASQTSNLKSPQNLTN